MKNILSQNAFWIINKDIARLVGLEAALLLSDLVTKQEYFDEEWFFNTSDNIENDTTLKRFKQDAAIKKLIEHEFIEVKLTGVPPKKHFKIATNQIVGFLQIELLENNNIYNKNTINKNKLNVTPQNKFEVKKDKPITLFSKIKLIFAKTYSARNNQEYYFTARDGAKVKSLIKKLLHAYKSKGMLSPTDTEMEVAFEEILNRALADKWLKVNFSLSNIDSQFNKLKTNTNNGIKIDQDTIDWINK